MNFEEKTVSSEEIYDGKIIKVRKEKVELPDGRLAMRELIGHPAVSELLRLTGTVRCLWLRSTELPLSRKCLKFLPAKWSTAKILWNVVQGSLLRKRDTRRRNLHISANITQHRDIVKKKLNIFLARKLTFVGQNLDDGEFLNVSKYSLDELYQMVMDNKIYDAKTAIAILKAKSNIGLMH